MILQISTLLNSQLPNINFSKLIDTFLNPSVTFIIGILTVLLTRNAINLQLLEKDWIKSIILSLYPSNPFCTNL